METQAFIQLIADHARKSYPNHRIFPSIIIAQAILESGWGNKVPVDPATGRSSYNLFGIKGTGPAGSVTIESKEVENGKTVTRTSQFRAYENYQQSIEDHAQFLRKPAYKSVLAASTPAQAAQALEEAGYATDPAYAEKLTHLIQAYNLTQYDQFVPEEPQSIPPWKLELGNRALQEGLLTSPEWLNKLEEPMPVWAVLAVTLRLLDKQREKP
ncbi:MULTISPECIES: glycoside hydrolase family 73 protein [Brevibacillus]|uniref:glycoside hydrolase family 73 protein n=1 Tax=Brevibacillus TaxID=55080 RepID=UPI000D114EA6|nr:MULTISPECIES: glycoside hydrolase family 73 protein [Brevibacillus]MED1947310.1 glycoside hydrolase family 73 protein [Brevibacillus formosus]MED1997423.1 glycoside hydrolase family 73 protein [Brevibacillus formosus]MED2083280.1 glycoside hydrolase family 73 protein [Brevibacillus formosus]PSK16897.1 muramidase [Brevibacillus sp. NRRL NRS-603]